MIEVERREPMARTTLWSAVVAGVTAMVVFVIVAYGVTHGSAWTSADLRDFAARRGTVTPMRERLCVIVSLVGCAAVASTALPQVVLTDAGGDGSEIDPYAATGRLGAPNPVGSPVTYEAEWYRFRGDTIDGVICAARTDLDPPPADVPSTVRLALSAENLSDRWIVDARYVGQDETQHARTPWVRLQVEEGGVPSSSPAFVWHPTSPIRTQSFHGELTAPRGAIRLQFRLRDSSAAKPFVAASAFASTAEARQLIVEGWPIWARPVCGVNSMR